MADTPQFSPEDQGIYDALMKRYGLTQKSAAQNALSAGATAAGATANTMANNRSAGIDAASQQEVLDQARQRRTFANMLSRDENRMASGADARKAALQSAYRTSADRGVAPGVAGKYSRNASTPALDPAIEASIRAEQERRLAAGDSLVPAPQAYQPFQFDPDRLKASALEKGFGVGSLAGSVAGAIPSSGWKKVGNVAGKLLKFIF